MARQKTTLDHVVIRFVGDSGDGMQLTGTEFTKAAAAAGNDIATFPDFPAEIRAPAGSLAGVSGFQVHFSSEEIYTAGDEPSVLVVMNPAALKTNLADLAPRGILIVNTGSFTETNLRKAGYAANPLQDERLANDYRLYPIDISQLTNAALEGTDLSQKEKARCKNFFALGLVFWLYGRGLEREIDNIRSKFARRPTLAEANIRAFRAGYHYGETAELFQDVYDVKPAPFEPGVYRNITGNESLAIGLVIAAQLADRQLVYTGYPITPASTVLHYLARLKRFGVMTFQAEDEIAAIGAAIGAAYGGSIAVTASSGPGIALKGEGIGLAVMTELPLVIINIQRAGPSTGLPTKTEQADLFQALWGRNGESPVPVLAAMTPGDAFFAAIEAVRVATKYMVPVILLSDGGLASGSEPWKIPDLDALPDLRVPSRMQPQNYHVYARDPKTLAREWVVPGTPGLEHRIGGLEKDALTGNVSYDPDNHAAMVQARADKVARVSRDLGPLDVSGDQPGELLLIGWGGTFGALRHATTALRQRGHRVAHVHLRWICPLHPGLDELIGKFARVLVAELNLGQLRTVLRARYLVDIQGINKVEGQPFKVGDIVAAAERALGNGSASAGVATWRRQEKGDGR